MARQYTAEELIAVVRDRGGFNNVETEGTDDPSLLKRLNEECLTTLYNAVMQAYQEYYVVTTHQTITAGTARYRIPHRAMLQKLRSLRMRVGSTRYPLLREFARDDLNDLDDAGSSSSTVPVGYYIEGNTYILLPDISPSYSGLLEVSYFHRPGELVLSTEARRIAAGGVNTATKTITLTSAIPSTWIAGVKIDIHSPYSGAEIALWDLTIASATSTTITFTEEIDGSVAGTRIAQAEDWVVLAEEAALPAIPKELHPLLAEAVVVQIIRSRDPERYQIAKADLDGMITRALSLMIHRVDAPLPTLAGRPSVIFTRRRGPRIYGN